MSERTRNPIPHPLKVLDKAKIPFTTLNNSLGADKRYPESAVQTFLLRNADVLRFLDIQANGEYQENGQYCLSLSTSKYVGCVPLLSPKGLPTGNLIVTGRFGEDVSELLSVIGDFIRPEFHEKYELKDGSYINRPLYFECQGFIDLYIEAKKLKWRKFNNQEKIQTLPKSSTNWVKYALRSYNPDNTLRYPNRNNELIKDHREWLELNYVLDLCIEEIMSTRTPIRSRMPYMGKISSLIGTYDKNSLPYVDELKIHMADPNVIKELKEVGNRILQAKSSVQRAWRLDFSEFFERYVQYIMQEVARTKGARSLNNTKYSVYGNKPGWVLRYIEPDVLLEKNEIQYIVDAKYKAHMYQINGSSEELKDTFRHDFHQVLAYSSFGGARHKNVILAYPSSTYVCRELNVVSGINGYTCNAYLVGIPLKKIDIEDTIRNVSNIILF